MRGVLQADDKNNVRTVVFDIDGVLADNSARYARLDRTNPDWTDFHHDQHLDPVIEGNVTLLRLLWAGGYNIVLMTNRKEPHREQTEGWLTANDIPYTRLVMRGVHHPYEGAKAGYVQDMLDDGCPVVLFVDDDPDHCASVQDVGVPTLYVHSGYKDIFNHFAKGSIPDDPIGAA